MGPEGAVNILKQKEIAKAADPKAAKDAYIAEYREKFANPFKAAELGYIDGVIMPRDTRKVLARALATMENKRDKNPSKKHGNIPL